MERPEPQRGTQTEVFGKRVLAVVVDMVLVAIVSGVLAGLVAGGNPVRNATTSSALGSLLTFAYFTSMEAHYGQTIGKKLLSIVVVTEDGSPLELVDAAVRNLLRFIDAILFYLVGAIVIFVTADDQRLGDVAADTLVVRTAAQ